MWITVGIGYQNGCWKIQRNLKRGLVARGADRSRLSTYSKESVVARWCSGWVRTRETSTDEDNMNEGSEVCMDSLEKEKAVIYMRRYLKNSATDGGDMYNFK